MPSIRCFLKLNPTSKEVMQQKIENMANPTDVASIDAIIAAAYDSISGPAGEKRDWKRVRSLFIPGARLVPTLKEPGATSFEGKIAADARRRGLHCSFRSLL